MAAPPVHVRTLQISHPSPDPMDYLQQANAGHQPPDNSPQLGPGQSTDRSIMLGESGWENTSTATRNSTAVDQNHRDDEMLVFSQVPSQSASAQISAGGDTEDEMLVLSQCPSAQKSYSATSNDDSELEVLDQTELWAKTPEVIDIRTDEDDIIFVSDGCTSAGSTSTAGVNGRVDDRAIFQFDSKRTPSGCAKKSPQKTGTGDRTAQVVKSKVNSPKRKRPPAAVGSSPSKGKKARTPTKSCREVLDADSDQLMLIPGTTGRGTKGGQSATVTSAKCTETSSVATTSSTPSKSATSSYTKRTSASATKSKSLICSSSLSSASSLSSVWPTAATPSKPVASSHPPSTSAAAASATKSKSSACSSSSSRLSSSQPTNSKAFAHASSQLSSSQPANSASKSKTSARSSSRLSSSQPTNSAAKSKNPARSSSSSLISSSQPASSRKRKAKDDDDDSDCVITVWDHKKELERMSRDVTKDPTKQSLVSTPAKKVQRSLRDWFSPSGKENDGTEVRKKELNAMSKVKRESAIQFQSKSDNLQKRTAEQNLVLSKQSVTECTKQSTTKCTVVLQQLALEERASSSTSSVHKPERASQSFAQKKCTPVSASRVSVQKQCAPQCEPDTTVADCVQEQSTSDGVAGVAMQEKTSADVASWICVERQTAPESTRVAMQEETSADVASLVSVERQTAPESMSHLLEQITPRKDSALGAVPSNKPRTESNKSSVACVEGVSGLGTSQSLSSVDTATLTLPTPAALAGVSDPLLLRHPVCTRVTPVNSSMKRIQNSRGKPPAVLSPRPQNNTRIGRRTRNQTDRISKFLATVRRKRKASNQVPDKAQDTSEAGSPLKLETKTVPAKRVKTVRGLSRKLAVENLLQNSVQSMTKCTVVLQQLALEERASSSTSSVHKPERASQSFAQKKCTPVSASRVSVQKQCAPQCEPDTTVADCVQEQSTSDGVAGVAMQEETSADVASLVCVERQTAPESTEVAMQEKTSADVASWVCVERQTAPESTRVAMQEETSADVASLVSVERQTAPESMSHLLEQITPRKDSALGAGPSNKPRTESNKSSVACVEGVSGLGTSQSLSSVDTATLTLPTPAALAGVSDPLLLRHPVCTRVTPVNSSMKRIRNSQGKPPAVLSPRPQNNTRIGRRTRNQTDRMSKFLATVRRKRKASNQVPDKAQDTSEAGSPLKLETKTVPAKRVKTVWGLSRKLAVENLLQNSVQSMTKCTVVLQQLALEERASSSTSSVHKPERASQSFAQKKCTPVSASRVSVQKQCAPQCEPDTTVADCVQEQSTSDGVAGVAMQEETSEDFASLVCVEKQTAPESTRVAMQEKTSADVASWVCVERQTAPESMSHLLEQIAPRKDSALGASPSNKPRTESNKSSVACVEGVSGLGTSQSLSSVDTATLTLPTPAALAGVSDPLLLRHPVSTRVTPVNSSMKRIRNSRGKPPAVLSPRPQNNTRIGRRTRNQTDRMSKFLATVRRKRKASNQVPDKAQDTSEAGSPLKLETKTVPAKRVKTVRGLSRKLAVENLLQNSEQSTTKCTVVLQQLALEERASSSTSSVHKPERASQSFAQKKCTPVSASRVSVQKQCAPQCEPDTTVADCVQEQSTSDGVAGVAMQEETSADVASLVCVERQTAPESTEVAMQEKTSADVASWICVERQTAPESTRVAMQEETSADVASLVSVERQTAPESMSHLLEQITPRKDSALGAGPSNKPRTESNKSSVACVEGVSGLGTSQSLSSVDTATLTLPTPAALAGVSDPLLLRHPVCTRVTPVNSSMKRIRNSRGKPPAVLSPRPQNNTRIGRRTRNQTDRMSKFLATVRRKRKASNQVPDKAQDTSEAGSPLKLETKTVPAKRVKNVRGLSRKLAVENLLQNSVQSMTKCTVVLQQLALEERASSSTSSVHKPERASQSFAQKKCTPVSASRVSVQKQCAPQCEPDTTVADCVQEQSTSDGVAGVAMQEKTSEDFASLVCVERQTAPESTRVAMQEETSADVASLVSVERQTAPESMSHLLEQIAPRKDSALGASPSNKPRTESNKSSVACVECVSGLGTSQSLSSVDTATLTLPTPAALAGVSDPLLVSTRVTPVNSSMKKIRNSRGKPPAVLSPRPQNNTRIGRRTRNQTDRMSKFLATVRRKRKASNQVPDKAQDTSEAGSPLKLETKTVPAKRVKTVRGLCRKPAVENLLQNSEPDSDVEKKEYAIATVSNLVQEISTTASEVRQRNSNPASSMEKKVSENVQISVSRRKEIKDSSAFSPGEMGWRTIPESLNGMMSICVDDSDFQSAICTVMSVRTSSPSVEMVKHLVTVIKKADKVNLVDQGLAVLNAWLDKYPPVTPGLRTVYEKGLALDSWETFRTILQDAVCEAEVEEDLDDSKSASGPRARLILRTVVKALEKNFHQFMQNASRQGRIQCLVIRSLWSPSYQVYPNGRTRDLLLFLETALKHLDTPQSCWQELVKLVSMATQCCHLVDNNWQYSAGGLVDRCSSAMVLDLTQAISGGGISSSRQLQQVLSCVSPPWLLRQVSAVMLEEYDDYLVPGGLTSGPVTLQSIVSKFFFLLPKLSAQSKSVNVSPRKKVKKEDGVKDENKAPPAGLTADKINKKNHKGETMLHRAAIKNNISLLKQLLSVPGVDVNAQDYAGWTPLHEACNHGNTECARALLKFVPCATLHSFVQSGKRGKLRKVDLTLANEEGITPLHDAVMSNQIAVVKLLLKYRGSSLLTAKTTLGCTPLEVATTEEMRQVLNRDSLDASLSLDFSLSQESFTQDMDSQERESVPSSFLYREVLDSSAIPVNSGPSSSTSSGTQLSALLEESRRFLTLLTFLLTSHIQVQKQERRLQQKRQQQQEEKQQQGQKQAEDFEERELKFHAQSLRRHMKKITTEEVFNGLTLQLTLIETLLVNCGAH